MFLTLKNASKIHLKILSAFVVCCKFLRRSLIWVYPVCWKGFSIISADNKSRQLVVIGVLSFKTQHVSFFFPIQLVHHDHTLFSLVSLVELSTTLPRNLPIRPHQQAVLHTQVETQLVLDRSTIQVLEKVRS